LHEVYIEATGETLLARVVSFAIVVCLFGQQLSADHSLSTFKNPSSIYFSIRLVVGCYIYEINKEKNGCTQKLCTA
jgi:hypothetical protein